MYFRNFYNGIIKEFISLHVSGKISSFSWIAQALYNLINSGVLLDRKSITVTSKGNIRIKYA